MDLSFSAKSQTLTLISCTPLSSSSSSSSSKLRSIRREFLGSAHNLRPPGLRSRRKTKKLGLQIQSPRFLFRASFSSVPILVVVVAVATLSVLSIVYLNYSRRRKNAREVSGPQNSALSQLGRYIMNQVIKGQILVLGDLDKEISDKESKALMDKMRENSHASGDFEALLQSQESTLRHEEALITEALESPGSDVLASSASDCAFSKESDISGPSLPPPVFFNSGVQQPLIFATDMSELRMEGCRKGAEVDSEMPALMVKTKSGTASVPLNVSHAELNELKSPKHELGEEGGITGYNGFFRDSVRKELYTFFEANQSLTKSVASLNGLKKLSSNVSPVDSNIFSSLMREPILNGSELSAKDSLHTAECVEGKIPLASYKEGSFHQRKDLGNGRGFRREKERGLLPQSSHRNMVQFPYSNGMRVNDKHYPLEQFSAYNHLLRNGRLTDCIQLLEDMERMGLLDMNKVYHAKFFKICKSQKAVKEAFSFTKLIPNPTLSTFNMLMSVCANSQDSEGAFQVLRLAQEAGLKADCKLYTTLISTCAKSGKVDAMFEVFHEMVNAKVEPNVHTYGALIDGCARAGQVAKAFGAYGIMRSKNVKPDRVVFNALITACGQAGAVDRAFDVLAEMTTETQPIDPDHVTVGALIKACMNAGQVDRAREAYKMIHQYNIKGTPEVYTIAVNSCSQSGDWEFALSVYNDMTRKAVVPDEMFLSALIDVAGHAGKVDAAFEVLQQARNQGIHLGIVSYSSLMGACSNAKNWEMALELYKDIKSIRLNPAVSTMNALITALCDGNQLQKAMEVLSEMKRIGLCPNTITYSILLVASEKNDDLEVGLMLLSQAKKDGVSPNLVMCRSLIGMCLRRFEKACTVGEPVLSFNSGRPQIDNKWTSLALMVYRETIVAGVVPTMEVFSQVLGCLQLPHEASLRNRLVENLDVSIESTDTSKRSNLCSLIDGFGEYDPRAISLLEEAASLGIVPCVSFKESPIVVDARSLQIHTAEVYLLTVLKGLKHRLAAGAKLPNTTILLPKEKTQTLSPGGKTINLAGRISQAVAALLRRLRLPYQGSESYGKIRINGLAMRRWLQPNLASPLGTKPAEFSSSLSQLGEGISYQQRNIRTGNLSLE